MPSADGTVAITGAAGYLGGRTASLLGDSARALVRTPVRWLPDAMQVPVDLLGPADELDGALAGAGGLIHLAGHNEVIASRDPDRATEETVAMAEAVLASARRQGVPRIVYVSTVHVYGEHLVPGATVSERTPTAPTSAYARARLACERVFLDADDVETVVLRLSNAVGAPADPSVDRWTLVANDLSRSAVLDRKMVLHSSGQQWRDFIALTDACRLVAGSLDASVAPGVYNLAAGTSAMVRSLAELVQDRVEQTCGWRPVLDAPEPTGEPDEPYVISVDALGAHGLRAETPLKDAVDEIIDHCARHQAALRHEGDEL